MSDMIRNEFLILCSEIALSFGASEYTISGLSAVANDGLFCVMSVPFNSLTRDSLKCLLGSSVTFEFKHSITFPETNVGLFIYHPDYMPF